MCITSRKLCNLQSVYKDTIYDYRNYTLVRLITVATFLSIKYLRKSNIESNVSSWNVALKPLRLSIVFFSVFASALLEAVRENKDFLCFVEAVLAPYFIIIFRVER